MARLRPCVYPAILASVLATLAAEETFAQEAKTLRVAAAQIPVTRDISANSAAIHRALDVAIRERADILLTPARMGANAIVNFSGGRGGVSAWRSSSR